MIKPAENSDVHSQILFQGGIPDLDEEGNEKVGLTGSSYEYEIGGIVFLVDFGMFQGGSEAETFNKRIPDISKYDGVIITHAHIDHIGKLPLLYKAGYRGPIYMTEATAAVGREMMLDTAKIEQVEVEKRMGQAKRLKEMLEKSMRIVKDTEKLKGDGLDVAQRNRLKSSIGSIIGKNDAGIALNEAIALLKEYNIQKTQDINQIYNEMLEPLFTEEDVTGVLQNVIILEYGKETPVIAKKNGLSSHSQAKRNTLKNLPLHVQKGYDQIQKVTKQEKNLLLQGWKAKQKTEKKDQEKEQLLRIEDDVRIVKTEKEFYNLLSQSYIFVSSTWPDIQLGLDKQSDEYSVQRAIYEEHQQLLDYYDIETEADVQKVVSKYGKPTSFLPSDYKTAESLLQVENEGIKERKKSTVTLTANNTAHVVGSAGVTVKHYTEKTNVIEGLQHSVNQSAQKVLDHTGESITAHFGGDLGRYNESNRLGVPEIPYHPVDWLQIECTYGGKNHPSRAEAVNSLMNSIDKSSGDVLISAFSQQRAQELACTILEQLAQKKKLGTLGDDIGYDIFIDGPLAKKITELYFKFEGKTYNILKESTQVELFGRVIIRFLEEGEIDTLYQTGSRKKVIIASSGMADAGAILAHMRYILPKKSATLIAPGYLSEGTLGNEIVVQGTDSAKVGGERYNVACKTEQIQGFSSHIGHDEILTYVWKCIKEGIFKENATIALTHGSRDGAESLQRDINEMLQHNEREDVSVTIPKIFSKYDVQEHAFLGENSEEKSVNSSLSNDESVSKKPLKTRVARPKKIPVFLEHIEPVAVKISKPIPEKTREEVKVEELFSPIDGQEYIEKMNKKSSHLIEEFELSHKRADLELLKDLAKNTDLENSLREIYTLSREQKNILHSRLKARQKSFKDIMQVLARNNSTKTKLTLVREDYSKLLEKNAEEVEKYIGDIIQMEFDIGGMQEKSEIILSSMNQLEENISILRNEKNTGKEVRKKEKTLFKKKQEYTTLNRKISKKESEIQGGIQAFFAPLSDILQNDEQKKELSNISNNMFCGISEKLLNNLQSGDNESQEIYKILQDDRNILQNLQSLFLKLRRKQQQLEEKQGRINDLEELLEDASTATTSLYIKVETLKNDIDEITSNIEKLISINFSNIDNQQAYSILERVSIGKTSERFSSNNDEIQALISDVWLELDTEKITQEQDFKTKGDMPMEIKFRKNTPNYEGEKVIGNDFDFNSSELEASVLRFLSDIFDTEYFDASIKGDFNVFHFLLSTKNIFQYIEIWYDISKIDVIEKNQSVYLQSLEDLEGLFEIGKKIQISATDDTDKSEMGLYVHGVKENHREIKNMISSKNG